MKILIIDNYDSFTYNLVQQIGSFVDEIIVKRNDKISIDEINDLNPDKIVISPGPGNPEDSGVSLDVIKILGIQIPVLGVCLGHQGIGYSFGGKIVNAPYLMHGKVSNIHHNGKTIYKNLEQGFSAGRYHSLVIEKESMPDELDITSQTEDGIVISTLKEFNFILNQY